MVVNPGSVGQPRDGDPRAGYAIIDGGKVELRRVDYPIDDTVARVEASTLPERAKRLMINSLRFGRLAGAAPSDPRAESEPEPDPDTDIDGDLDAPGDNAEAQE
jgi:hypothetical protein